MLTIKCLTPEVVRANMRKFVKSAKWVSLSEDHTYIVVVDRGTEHIVSYYQPNKSLAIQVCTEDEFLEHYRRTGNVLLSGPVDVTENDMGVNKSTFALWEMMALFEWELELPAPEASISFNPLKSFCVKKRSITLCNGQYPLATVIGMTAKRIPHRDGMFYSVSKDGTWSVVINDMDNTLVVLPYGIDTLRGNIEGNRPLGVFVAIPSTDKWVAMEIYRQASRLGLIE